MIKSSIKPLGTTTDKKKEKEKASELINEHRSLVEKVIQILLEEETVAGEEIQYILCNAQ